MIVGEGGGGRGQTVGEKVGFGSCIWIVSILVGLCLYVGSWRGLFENSRRYD